MSNDFKWCGWRDLNPHALRRQNLNLVRLPISPHPHTWPRAAYRGSLSKPWPGCEGKLSVTWDPSGKKLYDINEVLT